MSFNERTLVTIEINGQAKEIAIIKGMSLLEILQKSKVAINSSCGGQASCGTCKVKVLKSGNEVSSMSKLEKEFFEFRDNTNLNRLACQIFPEENLQIKIIDQQIPK